MSSRRPVSFHSPASGGNGSDDVQQCFAKGDARRRTALNRPFGLRI